MTGGRRFVAPDWGQDHLSLDAIVAFVDDELTAGAHGRATEHLDRCRECRAEVVAQRQARTALRGAGGPCLPSSLLRSLRSIPVEAELPPPPPGLGITADGQFVLLRDVPPVAVPACRDHPPGAGATRRFSRRGRVGAVSGLALGALAVGALAVPGQPAPPGPGVLGGAVLNGSAQARLNPSPAAPAVIPASVPAVDPTVDRSPEPAPDAPTAPDATAPDATAPDATAPDATAPPTGEDVDATLRERLDGAPVAFRP